MKCFCTADRSKGSCGDYNSRYVKKKYLLYMCYFTLYWQSDIRKLLMSIHNPIKYILATKSVKAY